MQAFAPISDTKTIIAITLSEEQILIKLKYYQRDQPIPVNSLKVRTNSKIKGISLLVGRGTNPTLLPDFNFE